MFSVFNFHFLQKSENIDHKLGHDSKNEIHIFFKKRSKGIKYEIIHS